MRILGIDYGSRRIGLALSDESGSMAFPHSVVLNTGKAISATAQIVRENSVGMIVIGESLDYKGSPNKIMPAVLRFKAALESETGLPVVLEKEFLTTAEATRLQGESRNIDASAAALILKSYIDKRS